ncbi:hypothetical protein MettiDRAFT_2375 [Methanolobus tindarius DSM 2278]|uniref:Uncharacterized protein n=1 Tax=Methanolobus tindarius DSM 2278 TaxID=1090322 RepID=W9DYU1_METTI|nr:hypothetical protein [Methanolobus tindarius]ETA68887.1 hypothetical protein MettiDRAFT_2375 [Methanolobus tindarius DSM 2278]
MPVDNESEFKISTLPRGHGALSPTFMNTMKGVYESMKPLMDALRKGYIIEDRSFIRGEEHLLPSDELAWLNQKLIERHCLPIIPRGGLLNRAEFEKLLPIVIEENKDLIEALSKK